MKETKSNCGRYKWDNTPLDLSDEQTKEKLTKFVNENPFEWSFEKMSKVFDIPESTIKELVK